MMCLDIGYLLKCMRNHNSSMQMTSSLSFVYCQMFRKLQGLTDPERTIVLEKAKENGLEAGAKEADM